MKEWIIGEEDEHLGEVVSMALISGEPYRFFRDKDGMISMMPLDALQREEKLNSQKDRDKN